MPHPLPFSKILTRKKYAMDIFYSEGNTDLDDYEDWLELKITPFEVNGFKCNFKDANESTKIISVIPPFRRAIKEEEILKCLDKSEVGNISQINALRAWQYLQFARAFWE